MSTIPSPPVPRLAVLALAVAVCVAARPAGARVDVALTPESQSVAPGTDIDVFVDVTQAGSSFNGFRMVLRYDPAVLTLLPSAPATAQQGCLMTGSCSSACGQTFHAFNATADSIVVSDVLLCDGVALTGPGRLYHLRFHTTAAPQATVIQLRSARFYDAGVAVDSVFRVGADVRIGLTTDVEGPPVTLASGWRAEPNPSFGRVRFVGVLDGSGDVTADVLDAQGRTVRRLSAPGPTAGPLEWDGRDASGARARPGVYWLRVALDRRVSRTRFVLLP